MTLIGVLGGGQLGRMLALAGYPLGITFRFLDHAQEAPAGQVAELRVGEFQDPSTLDRFAEGCTVLTYEFENVPVSATEHLGKLLPVYPPPAALHASQDRLTEKTFLRDLGIPTAPFAAATGPTELREAAEQIGYPSILKTRRMGYDGKGQVRVTRSEELASAAQIIETTPGILEAVVPFERELSLIAVRNVSGQTAFYPLVENHHEGGILRKSIAPAPGLSAGLQQLAEHYARIVMEKLEYVGVLAIEFFQLGNQLVVNEMAPRVHNSGHWTIEGAETSQFENHLRAILDLPLGSTAPRGNCLMLNCIGTMPSIEECSRVTGLHYHNYGKAPRAGRKVGHLTCCCQDETELRRVAAELKPLIAVN